jgi:hypothetical protein
MTKYTVSVMNNLLHNTHIQLKDAQALGRQYDTFDAPKRRNLKKVKKGSVVKICDGKERFWVRVENRKNNLFLGTIQNNLIFGLYTHGDLIAFQTKNIYDISCY